MTAVTLALAAMYTGKGGCLAEALSAMLAEHNATDISSMVSPSDVLRIRVCAHTHTGAADAGAGCSNTSVPDFTPDYVYSSLREGVTLGQAARVAHGFRVWNLSMSTSCASAGGGGSRPQEGRGTLDNDATWALVAFDTVVINAAMYTFPDRAGFMLNAETGEGWDWAPVAAWETSLRYSTSRGYFISFLVRLGLIAQAVIAFALLSGIAAMYIRVVTESGPAAIFPCISMCRRCCCVPAALAELTRRDVSHAYPWVGVQVAYLRAREASISPLIFSHLVWLAFSTVVFIIGGTGIVTVFYAWKSIPQGLQVAILAFVLAQEYFAFMFVRTKQSIMVFPRVAMLVYVLFHVYASASPYPFTDGALAAWSLWIAAVMAYTAFYFEVPALIRGDLSFVRPRHAAVVLPAPASIFSAPALWSVFHPPNAELVGAYDGDVPQRELPTDPDITGLPPRPNTDNPGNTGGVTMPQVVVHTPQDGMGHSDDVSLHDTDAARVSRRPLLTEEEFDQARR